MAINPNTDFTAGQVLTSSQANRFPRGIMTAVVKSTTTYTLTTTNTIQITSGSFTAAADRLYKIIYFEPVSKGPTIANGGVDFQIKNGATILNSCSTAGILASNIFQVMSCVYIGTLAAGATTITALAVTGSTSGTPQLQRSANTVAFLSIEDIGPA